MTSKDLHIAVKMGHGTQYMMQRHHFEDEETLFEAIRTISPSGAPEFISGLKKNQKRIDKKAKRNTQAEGVEESFGEGVELYVEPKAEEEIGEVENCEEEATAEESEVTEPLSLETLKADEEELSGILRGLESAHKQMVAERRECVKKFEFARKALLELQRLLVAQQKNVTTIYEEYENLDKQMRSNSREQAEYRELLEIVRFHIEDMTKVAIMVYKNGSIEMENAEIPSITEESINGFFAELISFAVAEEYTIKQLKTVAKVRLMEDAIKQDNRRCDTVFECERMQALYDAISE